MPNLFLWLVLANILHIVKGHLENFVAASTNDLSRLFSREIELIDHLDNWSYLVRKGEIPRSNQVTADSSLVKDILLQLNCTEWRFDDPLDYVSHPINAYHLLKRTTTLWQDFFENTQSKVLEDTIEEYVASFPDIDDFNYGACSGLINIELYYGSNGNSFLDLAKGRVTFNGKVYQARHNLSSSDFLHIADAAKRGNDFNRSSRYQKN